MSMLPLRNIGKGGSLPDIDPQMLPPEAIGFAKNVRRENGKLERGGVFRTIGALAHPPRMLLGYFDSSGNNNVIYGDNSGNLYSWTNGVEANISPAAGWTPAVASVPMTVVSVNNMIYVNREDHVPFYRSQDATGLFSLIPTGATQWDATFRCKALRSMNDILVAFNVTKGATAIPTMVKWSNIATSFNAAPADWDITSTTSSAGENTLAQMKGQIVDGCLLKDRMMIYGTQEVWSMDYVGGNDIFAFDRLFDFGIINQNCVIEHDGLHYIFGLNDIKKTDGISPVSIADGRVRRFIFDNIVNAQSDYCFTAHNPSLNEIMFCFVSNDAFCAFPPSTTSPGCNRAAIYNYAGDEWYFADLPYVSAADLILPLAGAAWSAETAIDWSDFGGSWAQLQGDPKLNLVFAGTANGAVTQSLRTFDRKQSVSTATPIDVNANGSAYIERDDVNLDAIRASLRGYKLVSSIYPQGRIEDSGLPLRFSIGFADHPNLDPTWGVEQTFDQSVYYKLDYNMAGRYLSWRMFQDDFQSFTLTGMDADVTILGEF